ARARVRVAHAKDAPASAAAADRDEEIALRSDGEIGRREADVAFRLEEDLEPARRARAGSLARDEVHAAEGPARDEEPIAVALGEAIVPVDEHTRGRTAPGLDEALRDVDPVGRAVPGVLPSLEDPAVVAADRDVEDARRAIPRQMMIALAVRVVGEDGAARIEIEVVGIP